MLKPLAALALLATAPAGERTVSGDALVAVTVDGVPARLRVEPGAPGMPLLSPVLVERAGLRCDGLLCFGVNYAIGRERVNGRSAVTRVGWDGASPRKQRVGWLSRPYAMAADGAVGPGGVPEPVVRFALGPDRPGARTLSLPIEDGGLFGSWGSMRARLVVGGERISVRFDPDHPHSLATAAAGVAIARAQGGTLTETRGAQEILFGVERPFRTMTLARPLAVGPLALSSLGVRVTDGSGANTIPQQGDDPSEVVVNAKGKKTYMILSIGADALSRCSSLVFDKPAKQVRLTCA